MSYTYQIQRFLFRLQGNEFTEAPLDFYTRRIRNDKPFSFARYGDGEWNAILGTPGENCDGHPFYHELGSELRTALKKPGGYLFGLQPLVIKRLRPKVQRFISSEHIHIPWYDADVFHRANNAGVLFPIIEQLRKKPLVVIGPSYLRMLKERVFKYRTFIDIPDKNCYLAIDAIEAAIKTEYDMNGPAVFAFSASMTTKALIERLYQVIGKNSWMLDFGSVWDVYAGVHSRSNYADRKWLSLIRRNCGEPDA